MRQQMLFLILILFLIVIEENMLKLDFQIVEQILLDFIKTIQREPKQALVSVLMDIIAQLLLDRIEWKSLSTLALRELDLLE